MLKRSLDNFLIMLIFLSITATSLDYNSNHTVQCKNINTTNLTDNLEYLWPKLILHQLDKYFILCLTPIVFILQLLLFINYLKFRILLTRPGNIFFGILIIQMLLNLRLLVSAIYVTINSQYDSIPTHFIYFCSTMAIISTLLVILHALYLILFLLYVIFLFRFSLKKKSETFWQVLNLGIIIVSLLVTFILWKQNFMGLNYDGLCGIALTRKPDWTILLPLFILVVALFFSILGGFTYFYFHRHMPNVGGFQKIKYNQSKIIGMYVVGFSTYISLLGIFSLIININCQNSNPLPGITIFATISNLLKILQYFFLIYLIIKNHYFRYKLKKMLKGIFQQQKSKSYSDIYKFRNQFLQMQQVTFNQQFLQIKQQAHQIDLLFISQIFTIITGIYIAFFQYFQQLTIQNVKPIYYLQKTTFTLNNHTAIHYDTQVRLLAKLKILQCNMIIHSPKIFKNLLIIDGLHHVQESFSIFKNVEKLYNLIQGKGGKSGQFFFFSADNKFVLKTINIQQFQFLSQNLQNFYQYFIKNPYSLLAKIYGLFTLKGLQIQRTYHLILMKNILGCSKDQIQRTYDIKGSKNDREVLKHKQQHYNLTKQVLKDIDFIHLQGKIKINNKISSQLRQTLRKDTIFLKSLNLIDYSLLVVKVQWTQKIQNLQFWNKLQRIPSLQSQNLFYHIGIIDYMQKWDLQKKGQKWWKNLVGKKQVSAQEPNKYQNRFMLFIDQITINFQFNNEYTKQIQNNEKQQKSTKDLEDIVENVT